MKRILPFVIIAIVLVAGLVTARYLQRSASETPQLLPVASASPSARPAIKGEAGAEPAHALGSRDAPVTLEEFGDFSVHLVACFIQS